MREAVIPEFFRQPVEKISGIFRNLHANARDSG